MRNNSESGYTLVGVLAIFTIISILGLSLVTLSVSSVKTSKVEHDDQSVFYIAEAGANYAYEALKEETLDIYNSDVVRTEEEFLQELAEKLPDVPDDIDVPFEKVNNEQPKAEITVTQLSDEHPETFTISSTGTINNQSRTVEQLFTVQWQEKYEEQVTSVDLPPFAVFTSGSDGDGASIDLSNGGDVNGDIGVLSDRENNITISNAAKFNGTIYVPSGKKSTVNGPSNKSPSIEKLDQKYELQPELHFPNTPEATLTIEELGANHISDGIYTIVVDTLDTNDIKFKGNETLNIYIKDKINFNTKKIGKDHNPQQLNIFYKGNEPLHFGGGYSIWASIFAKQADIEITASGTVYGNIFTSGSKVTLQGGPEGYPQLIYAPNAHVKTSSGSKVHGMIMSKTFEMGNGGALTFQQPSIMNGPISPEALSHSGGGSGNLIETGAQPTISSSPILEIK